MNSHDLNQYTLKNQSTIKDFFRHINDEIELFRQIDLKFNKIEKVFNSFKITQKLKKSILKEILQHNCRMIDNFQNNIQIDNLPMYKNLNIEVRIDLVILVLQYKRNIFEIISITNRIYNYFQEIIEIL